MILLFFLFFFPLQCNAYTDTAHSSIVMDVDSGRILYQKNSHDVRLIASITKIMTCIIVLENADLDKTVVVGDEVLSMYGTSIYLEVGEKITIHDLLYGLMLRSGNDAAMVLATQTLGEEVFIQKMNEKAQELKMKDTVFSNPHGLDEKSKNYSTAYDMALLGRYAYQNKEYRKIISTKKYYAKSSFKTFSWHNRMSLLYQYDHCVGGKNGYTPAAGKTLVSYAKKDKMTLMMVSLDDSELYNNHQKMYDVYFHKFQKYLIIDKASFSVSNTFTENNLYIKKSFYYSLMEEEVDSVRTLVELYSNNQEQIVGMVHIQLNQEEIGTIPIYQEKRTQDMDSNSFFHDLFDNLKKFIEGLQNSLMPFSEPKPLDIYNSLEFSL